jgi:hypothetical protein
MDVRHQSSLRSKIADARLPTRMLVGHAVRTRALALSSRTNRTTAPASDMTVQAAFPDPEVARHAFDVMPSFDVSVSLKTAYHRNPAHNWTPNDIHDIDALASTLPYCDIVVTDKEVASHIVQTGLSRRFKTAVLRRLAELPKYL